MTAREIGMSLIGKGCLLPLDDIERMILRHMEERLTNAHLQVDAWKSAALAAAMIIQGDIDGRGKASPEEIQALKEAISAAKRLAKGSTHDSSASVAQAKEEVIAAVRELESYPTERLVAAMVVLDAAEKGK